MNEEIRDAIEAHGDCIGCVDRLECQKINSGVSREQARSEILEVLDNLQEWDEKLTAVCIEMSKELNIADFLIVAQITVNKLGGYIKAQKERNGGTLNRRRSGRQHI